MTEELQRIRKEVLGVLADGERLTPIEIAERVGAEEEPVTVVLKALYVDQEVELLYTYRIMDK